MSVWTKVVTRRPTDSNVQPTAKPSKAINNVKYSATENAVNSFSLEELLASRLQVGVVARETGGTVSDVIPGVVARLPGE